MYTFSIHLTYLAKTLLQYFDCLPLKINTFMSSFNNENDQCIAAHLFCFYIKNKCSSSSIVLPSK